MLQNIMEYLNTIKRHLGRIFMKFERDEDSEISFCVCSTRIFNYELLVHDTAYLTVGIVHSLKITSHVKAFSNDESYSNTSFTIQYCNISYSNTSFTIQYSNISFLILHSQYVTGPVKIDHVSTNYTELYFH